MIPKIWTKKAVYWIHAVHAITLPSASTRAVCLAVDVAGDGSCFWQCLAYSMMWYCLEPSAFPSSVRGMKLQIVEWIFSVDLDKYPDAYNGKMRVLPVHRAAVDKIVRKVNPGRSLAEPVRDESAFTLGLAAEKLGLRRERQSGLWVLLTKQHADELCIELASLAYGAQILVFEA